MALGRERFFEHSVEEQSPVVGDAPVEPEDELVDVAVEVPLVLTASLTPIGAPAAPMG